MAAPASLCSLEEEVEKAVDAGGGEILGGSSLNYSRAPPPAVAR